ncbi:hypothetical protein BDM02DRAFT_3260180 [Thelephora ganbajun]|uniref:Uncharacterized protein n=1 Tax=Thelephora ganbajun TaxID=370292 RepID=A0ACB6ZJP4_THEGA|nr:hypothetical protein BDM02DRAFT_3260180 [Thelephora ganbajun]
MFRKRRLTESGGSSGSSSDQGGSKKRRVAPVAKILLDITKDSAGWFPPLKSALGGVTALIERYEQFEDVKVKDLKPQLDRFRQNITTTPVDGDPEETGRRQQLTGALEEIEKRSQELLVKGMVTRFTDKEGDSGEVAKLVEWLQGAVTRYQMSQQQAIYDHIANLNSSLNTVLRLHKKSPAVKNKLDSAMARLDQLCSEEDNDDGPWDEDEHEHRAKLFDALRLIGDNGNVLCNRINVQGYKECQDDIQAASAMADDIRDAVIDYQMTQQRAIYDMDCRLIHGDRKGCLRGTRETVLNEIESWVRDFEKPPIFWLNGLAGTGKSTIAQTVSEQIFANGLLGTSFFCSRDFEDRSDLRLIFPTLAFQLAHKYPTFRSVLVPLLRSNPDIAHESLMNQMGELIVKPLKSADVWTVIVIDALDECKDEEPQSAILSVLGRFVKQIPKVKFFITGRPEPRIKDGFRLPLLVDSTDVFVLHDVCPSLINSDIRLFLKRELSEVARRRRVEGWPRDEHINILCHRAGGLFVYAVATAKFLDTSTRLPERQLDAIVNFPEHTAHEGKTRFNPKTTLDSLYTSILKAAFSEEDPEVDSKVRPAIGAVVLVVNPLPPPVIAELIGLDPREVTQFLTLIGDNGDVLWNHISTQGYEECQDDVQAVSAMADDIRDAVIDYQNTLTDGPATGDIRQELQTDRCRFGPSIFSLEPSSPIHRTADLSVLNSCRRAHGAGYQHGDRKGCLRGTRETVLNDIESWARDFKKPPIFWLNGLAGTGKSTIAQTVSEQIFANGLLGASFFCSRDFEDRSDLHLIFPTLAFQLAHKYPTFRSIFVPLLRWESW